MEAGDCFTLTNVDDHFWIIISDPKQNTDRVLFVSFTTWDERKDPACMVGRGEHEWVTHESCIAYYYTKEAKLSQLLSLKDSGALKPQKPVSKELLKRIWLGAVASDDFKPTFLAILQGQGLCEKPD